MYVYIYLQLMDSLSLFKMGIRSIFVRILATVLYSFHQAEAMVIHKQNPLLPLEEGSELRYFFVIVGLGSFIESTSIISSQGYILCILIISPPPSFEFNFIFFSPAGHFLPPPLTIVFCIIYIPEGTIAISFQSQLPQKVWK